MKPAAFTYHRPATLDEALALLSDLAPEAKPLAGGQSLGPMLNMRLANPAHLVDLNDLTELGRIRDLGDAIEVGALARHHQLADSALLSQHCPLLVQCAQSIGHYAIRQRGTLGGSLAATAQAAKTTSRAAINTSPEPFSNVAMSLLEDGLVIGIVWLATNEPLIFGGVVVVAVLVMWVTTWLLFKFLRAALRRLRDLFSSASAPA